MNRAENEWPVIVVGAGAAGLTAAIFAARAGVAVLALETRPKPGAKIRVSGGGRCNVLPSRVTLEDFHTSGSARSMRNVLFSWPLEDVRDFFERDLGVALKLEPSGKLFPRSDDAKDVVRALLNECQRCGVQLRAPFRVVDVQRRDSGSRTGFVVEGAKGERVLGRRLIIASGGLSLPKTGSDGGGMTIARRLGHRTAPPYPALVPLLTSEPEWVALRGVSVRVRLAAENGGCRVEPRDGSLLFTHRGFSGPVVLDISHHFTRELERATRLRVHWGGGDVADWDALLRRGGAGSVSAVVRQRLPRRLADVLLQRAGATATQRVSELPRASRRRLVEVLDDFVLPVSGSEGYKTAEVTGGGILLSEVVTASLESRRVAGLYFCGEILDVTGRLGGYNFLWAWVSGRKAGLAIAAAHEARDVSG